MKYFKFENFLKTIKVYVVFLVVGIMLISFGGLNTPLKTVSAEENSTNSVEIENNSTILNNDDTYNVESLTKAMFGDVQVKASEYLYNLDGASDYIYVAFENGGYAVYYKVTMELLEYSAQGSLNYPSTNVNKYYGGPGMYFTKQNDGFVDILTGKFLDVSSNSAKIYSNEVRDMLISNLENHEPQTSVDFDYSSIGVNDFSIENNISDCYYVESDLFNDIGADFVCNGLDIMKLKQLL